MSVIRRSRPVTRWSPPAVAGEPVVAILDDGSEFVGVVRVTPKSADAPLRIRIYDARRPVALEDAEADGWLPNPAVSSPWRNIVVAPDQWLVSVFPLA